MTKEISHNAPVTVRDVAAAIEAFAPLSCQEKWDNTGLQVGCPDARCTGVLVCVDVTPGVIAEAVERHCNMVVSHHPLLFHGLKTITGATPVEQAVIEALRNGVAVYSSHTATDSVAGGVSHEMARRLGVTAEAVLEPLAGCGDGTLGLGVVGKLAEPLAPRMLVERVKETFSSPVARCSDPDLAPAAITRMAMCGGAGGSLIAAAVEAGAQAYLTSDLRYHDFTDWSSRIFLIDIGHYESEACTRDILSNVIARALPVLPVLVSRSQRNPIFYI